VALPDLVRRRLFRAGRWVKSRVSRRHYVLVWIDDETGYARKLIKRLREMTTAQGLMPETMFHVMTTPRDLLRYPLSRSTTASVILLNTDVSKLADDPAISQAIQARLCRYVEGGGGVIGSHDLIYRRVRAEVLQKMFGCTITQFNSQPIVTYRPRLDHPLRKDLSEFSLSDGEVCWGRWAPDVTVVYDTEVCAPGHDAHVQPVVVARDFGEGRLVWLNSGDKTDWLCQSIGAPEEPLVLLLRNALIWVSDCV
jgi:type 1 glutamine amidotransferase